MNTTLEIIELSKNYNQKKAVNNISFKLNKNEIIFSLLLINWNLLGIFKHMHRISKKIEQKPNRPSSTINIEIFTLGHVILDLL